MIKKYLWTHIFWEEISKFLDIYDIARLVSPRLITHGNRERIIFMVSAMKKACKDDKFLLGSNYEWPNNLEKLIVALGMDFGPVSPEYQLSSLLGIEELLSFLKSVVARNISMKNVLQFFVSEIVRRGMVSHNAHYDNIHLLLRIAEQEIIVSLLDYLSRVYWRLLYSLNRKHSIKVNREELVEECFQVLVSLSCLQEKVLSPERKMSLKYSIFRLVDFCKAISPDFGGKYVAAGRIETGNEYINKTIREHCCELDIFTKDRLGVYIDKAKEECRCLILDFGNDSQLKSDILTILLDDVASSNVLLDRSPHIRGLYNLLYDSATYVGLTNPSSDNELNVRKEKSERPKIKIIVRSVVFIEFQSWFSLSKQQEIINSLNSARDKYRLCANSSWESFRNCFMLIIASGPACIAVYNTLLLDAGNALRPVVLYSLVVFWLNYVYYGGRSPSAQTDIFLGCYEPGFFRVKGDGSNESRDRSGEDMLVINIQSECPGDVDVPASTQKKLV